jgi:hypothetical protein
VVKVPSGLFIGWGWACAVQSGSPAIRSAAPRRPAQDAPARAAAKRNLERLFKYMVSRVAFMFYPFKYWWLSHSGAFAPPSVNMDDSEFRANRIIVNSLKMKLN